MASLDYPLTRPFFHRQSVTELAPIRDSVSHQAQPSQWSRGGSLARRRYQNGSLFLRQGKKQKVWYGQWREDMIDGEGKVQRVFRKEVLGNIRDLPTRSLAQRELGKRLERVNSFAYRPGRTATFAQFVESWRENILAMRKPSSAKAAESHLRVHLIPKLGKLRLDEIDRETIQQLVSLLSRKVSRHTLLNVLGTFGGIIKAAKDYEYNTGNYSRDALVLPSPKIRKAVRFFSADEAARILAAAVEEPFRTMFAVTALTGLRAGEVTGLSWIDLDMERQTITVRKSAWYGRLQTPKSRSALRTVPMPDALCDMLNTYRLKWRHNPMGLLFATRTGNPYSANWVVQHKLWAILDALKIPRCGFHAFRHAAATLLIDRGASPTTVQAQLGHSDSRTTLNLYSHVLDGSQREAVEGLAQILMPKDATVQQEQLGSQRIQ
jgi:integrase